MRRISQNARESQMGDKTQIHGQLIKSVSLRAINRMVSRPQKPMPPEPELLFFMGYLLKMGMKKPRCACIVVSLMRDLLRKANNRFIWIYSHLISRVCAFHKHTCV